ncbi:MAG: hypothetical protein JWQ91_1103, partial [Aeromicrobium sp.]|nr:hypothetical protein [Aeromicrobium sp.]
PCSRHRTRVRARGLLQPLFSFRGVRPRRRIRPLVDERAHCAVLIAQYSSAEAIVTSHERVLRFRVGERPQVRTSVVVNLLVRDPRRRRTVRSGPVAPRLEGPDRTPCGVSRAPGTGPWGEDAPLAPEAFRADPVSRRLSWTPELRRPAPEWSCPHAAGNRRTSERPPPVYLFRGGFAPSVTVRRCAGPRCPTGCRCATRSAWRRGGHSAPPCRSPATAGSRGPRHAPTGSRRRRS